MKLIFFLSILHDVERLFRRAPPPPEPFVCDYIGVAGTFIML